MTLTMIGSRRAIPLPLVYQKFPAAVVHVDQSSGVERRHKWRLQSSCLVAPTRHPVIYQLGRPAIVPLYSTLSSRYCRFPVSNQSRYHNMLCVALDFGFRYLNPGDSGDAHSISRLRHPRRMTSTQCSPSRAPMGTGPARGTAASGEF